MASSADPRKRSKAWIVRWAPWAFDAAILFAQGAGTLYVAFKLTMAALFSPLPDWMPYPWVLNTSASFHGWLGASLPSSAMPLILAFELLSFVALYVSSYVWLFSKLNCGTLGMQRFGRAPGNARRHRAARNVLALLVHTLFVQLLVWIALGMLAARPHDSKFSQVGSESAELLEQGES